MKRGEKKWDEMLAKLKKICQRAVLTKQAEDTQRIKQGIRNGQAKTPCKLNSFHIRSSRGRRECDVLGRTVSQPGLSCSCAQIEVALSIRGLSTDSSILPFHS